nr:S8 family serine peptidase [Ardenticatena sp.]
MRVRPSSFVFALIALVMTTVFILFSVPTSEPVAAEKSDIVPGQYIVVLDDSVSASALPTVANEMALRHGLGIGRSYTHAMRGFVATVPAGRLAALQADPRVRAVAPDRYVSFNPKPCRNNCDSGPQEIPTGIDRIDAELSATANIDGVDDRVDVDVAVIDTGISSHPDLNVVGGYNTISGTSMATPHVAGAAALYKATHPNTTPDDVKNALLSSGTTDWDNSDDPDGIKEPLLNVSGY